MIREITVVIECSQCKTYLPLAHIRDRRVQMEERQRVECSNCGQPINLATKLTAVIT